MSATYQFSFLSDDGFWLIVVKSGKLLIVDLLLTEGFVLRPATFRVEHLPSGKECISTDIMDCVKWLRSNEQPLDSWDGLYQKLRNVETASFTPHL